MGGCRRTIITHHDSISNQVVASLVDHSTGQEVEGVLVASNHEGVACVGASIESHAQLGLERVTGVME